MLGDPARLREEFANAGLGLAQRQGWTKLIAFALAVAVLVINSWTLVEFELSAVERVLGAYTVAATAGFVACALFFRNWFSTLAYVRFTHVVKIAANIAALIPVILVLSVMQVIQLQSRPLIEIFIWLFFAGVSFSVFTLRLADSGDIRPGGSDSGGAFDSNRPPAPTIPIPPSTKMALDSRALLEAARDEAESLGHDFIGTEHVLLGLLKVGKGGVAGLLERSKVYLESVRREVESLIPPGKRTATCADISLTPRARKALRIAGKEAVRLGQPLVTPDHVLLGLILEGSGVGAIILRKMGIRAEQICQTIASRR